MQQDVSLKRLAPLLGILGATGPLAIDMYLPAMPQIASDLGVGEGQVQFSLMAFFAGLMIAQLFYGPLSDRTGRKPMIYTGLLIYTIASFGCMAATTAWQLIGWRFVQGLGGSIGMVIGLAVVRDLFTGKRAASLVALIMIVTGVAPIIAPILGTGLLIIARWQMLFLVLGAFGIVSLLSVAFALPETRHKDQRHKSSLSAVVKNYAQLLTQRNFISYAGTLALSQAGFFAYLAGSSFIFISIYGVSASVYSCIFAINAAGMITGAQLAPRLIGRFSPHTIVKCALLVYAAAAILMGILELTGIANLLFVSVLLFVVITSQAFVMPINGMMALESYASISGTAAALMGSMQFCAGTLASFIVGATANGTAIPMTGTIAFCGICSCIIAFITFPKSIKQSQKRASTD